VVVCSKPPPVPFIAILWFPKVALPTLTVIVEVPEPGAGIELGLKVTVWAVPSPVADKAIDELKPSKIVVVIVKLPVPPLETLMDEGEALMVKPGFCFVTFRVTVAVSVVPPDVPLTLTL